MANIYDMADTWNDGATTFTAIKMNVTDTASASGSLLMDLQVGGSSKASIDKNGKFFSAINTGGSAAVSYSIETGSGYGFGGYFDSPALIHNGQQVFWANASGSFSTAGYWASSSGRFTFNNDTYLYRDAANTLAQRNSTNAQTFNIYNTYTDASNYERATFKWNANVLEIKPEAAGTGATRVIHISGLPTSNPGPGILWNNAGTPAIGT